MVDNAVTAKSKIRMSTDDLIFSIIVIFILTIIFLIVLYPLVYIVSASFSSPDAVAGGRVFLWPVEFSLEGYKAVFSNKDIIMGYANSIIYTLLGTGLSLFITIIAAYPLACHELPYRGVFMTIFTFTMLFSGGMIPHYMLIKDLNMLNTRWAIIIPGALSVHNLIVTRTFIQRLPLELRQAADVDGCTDIQYLIWVVLPLSKPIIAVITLYYAVNNWNEYFNAFLYLTDRKLFPLQVILREILVASKIDPNLIVDYEALTVNQDMFELMKYSLIIVSSLPVMMIYPFIQKYFIQGIMIGSIKG